MSKTSWTIFRLMIMQIEYTESAARGEPVVHVLAWLLHMHGAILRATWR